MSELANHIIQRFEQHFPLFLAEKGDPNGLQIGTLNKDVQKVMITLDVRPDVVKEAIEENVDLIIAKHPPIFAPIGTITDENPQQKMYLDLIEHHISVYAAHTNMDIVPDGLNDWFCEALDVKNTTYLSPVHTFNMELLTVMVPKTHRAVLQDALAKAGAGALDSYSETSFVVEGKGYFKPSEKSKPFIGEKNQRNEVEEEAIMVIVPPLRKQAIERTLLDVHPYETPAYYFQTINNLTETYGIGRVGDLEEAIPLNTLAERIKKAFDLDYVLSISKEANPMVKRVAICGGTGQKFYTDALKQGADVYITGDVYYHTGHDMMETPLAVIDPGHYMEHYCKEKIVDLCNQWKQELNWDVEFIASKTNTNPFKAL